MPTALSQRFSEAQLHAIIEQAVIYMCACPAQVAEQILNLRGLFSYQKQCLASVGLSEEVHTAIAEATQRAHDEMETCLEHIITLENWDRATMTMPPGLRQFRDAQIERI